MDLDMTAGPAHLHSNQRTHLNIVTPSIDAKEIPGSNFQTANSSSQSLPCDINTFDRSGQRGNRQAVSDYGFAILPKIATIAPTDSQGVGQANETTRVDNSVFTISDNSRQLIHNADFPLTKLTDPFPPDSTPDPHKVRSSVNATSLSSHTLSSGTTVATPGDDATLPPVTNAVDDPAMREARLKNESVACHYACSDQNVPTPPSCAPDFKLSSWQKAAERLKVNMLNTFSCSGEGGSNAFVKTWTELFKRKNQPSLLNSIACPSLGLAPVQPSLSTQRPSDNHHNESHGTRPLKNGEILLASSMEDDPMGIDKSLCSSLARAAVEQQEIQGFELRRKIHDAVFSGAVEPSLAVYEVVNHLHPTRLSASPDTPTFSLHFLREKSQDMNQDQKGSVTVFGCLFGTISGAAQKKPLDPQNPGIPQSTSPTAFLTLSSTSPKIAFHPPQSPAPSSLTRSSSNRSSTFYLNTAGSLLSFVRPYIPPCEICGPDLTSLGDDRTLRLPIGDEGGPLSLPTQQMPTSSLRSPALPTDGPPLQSPSTDHSSINDENQSPLSFSEFGFNLSATAVTKQTQSRPSDSGVVMISLNPTPNCRWHLVSIGSLPVMVLTSLPGVPIPHGAELTARFGPDWWKSEVMRRRAVIRQSFAQMRHERLGLPSPSPVPKMENRPLHHSDHEACNICFQFSAPKSASTANIEMSRKDVSMSTDLSEVCVCDGCHFIFHPPCLRPLINEGLCQRPIFNTEWFCHECVQLSRRVLQSVGPRYHRAPLPSSDPGPQNEAPVPEQTVPSVPKAEHQVLPNIRGDESPLSRLSPCWKCRQKFKYGDVNITCRLYNSHFAHSGSRNTKQTTHLTTVDPNIKATISTTQNGRSKDGEDGRQLSDADGGDAKTYKSAELSSSEEDWSLQAATARVIIQTVTEALKRSEYRSLQLNDRLTQLSETYGTLVDVPPSSLKKAWDLFVQSQHDSSSKNPNRPRRYPVISDFTPEHFHLHYATAEPQSPPVSRKRPLRHNKNLALTLEGSGTVSSDQSDDEGEGTEEDEDLTPRKRRRRSSTGVGCGGTSRSSHRGILDGEGREGSISIDSIEANISAMKRKPWPRGVSWNSKRLTWSVRFWREDGVTLVATSVPARKHGGVDAAFNKALMLRRKSFAHVLNRIAGALSGGRELNNLQWVRQACSWRAEKNGESWSFVAKTEEAVGLAWRAALSWLAERGDEAAERLGQIADSDGRLLFLSQSKRGPSGAGHPNPDVCIIDGLDDSESTHITATSATLGDTPGGRDGIDDPTGDFSSSRRGGHVDGGDQSYDEHEEAASDTSQLGSQDGAVGRGRGGPILGPGAAQIVQSLQPLPPGLIWARTTSRFFAVYKEPSGTSKKKRFKTFDPKKYGGVIEAFDAAVDFLTAVEPWVTKAAAAAFSTDEYGAGSKVGFGTSTRIGFGAAAYNNRKRYALMESTAPSSSVSSRMRSGSGKNDLLMINENCPDAGMDDEDEMSVVGSSGGGGKDRYGGKTPCRQTGFVTREVDEGDGLETVCEGGVEQEEDCSIAEFSQCGGGESNEIPGSGGSGAGVFSKSTSLANSVASSTTGGHPASGIYSTDLTVAIEEMERDVAQLPTCDHIKWYRSKRGFSASLGGRSKWFSAYTRGVETAWQMAVDWIERLKVETAAAASTMPNTATSNSGGSRLRSRQLSVDGNYDWGEMAADDSNGMDTSNGTSNVEGGRNRRRRTSQGAFPLHLADVGGVRRRRRSSTSSAGGNALRGGPDVKGEDALDGDDYVEDGSGNFGTAPGKVEDDNVLSGGEANTNSATNQKAGPPQLPPSLVAAAAGVEKEGMYDSDDSSADPNEQAKRLPKISNICWVPQKQAFSVFYPKGGATNSSGGGKTTKAFNPLLFRGVKRAFRQALLFCLAMHRGTISYNAVQQGLVVLNPSSSGGTSVNCGNNSVCTASAGNTSAQCSDQRTDAAAAASGGVYTAGVDDEMSCNVAQYHHQVAGSSMEGSYCSP